MCHVHFLWRPQCTEHINNAMEDKKLTERLPHTSSSSSTYSGLHSSSSEIKKATNFLGLVKLKVMDDNVCKLHIGPRAKAHAPFLPLLPLTKDELAFIIGSS